MKTIKFIILAIAVAVLVVGGIRAEVGGRLEYFGSPSLNHYLAKAPSGTSSNVSYRLSQMHPGGVLDVPTGASAWTNSITISNAITLRWGTGNLTISTGTVTWTGSNMVAGSGSSVATTTNTITAFWSAPADNRVTGYRLRYGLVGGTLTVIDTSATSVTITNLAAGNYYGYLTARNAWDREGPASPTNNITIR